MNGGGGVAHQVGMEGEQVSMMLQVEAAAGGTHFMHSYSLRPLDPRISTLPGLSTSSFHRSGRHKCAGRRDGRRFRLFRPLELDPFGNSTAGGGKNVYFFVAFSRIGRT